MYVNHHFHMQGISISKIEVPRIVQQHTINRKQSLQHMTHGSFVTWFTKALHPVQLSASLRPMPSLKWRHVMRRHDVSTPFFAVRPYKSRLLLVHIPYRKIVICFCFRVSSFLALYVCCRGLFMLSFLTLDIISVLISYRCALHTKSDVTRKHNQFSARVCSTERTTGRPRPDRNSVKLMHLI